VEGEIKEKEDSKYVGTRKAFEEGQKIVLVLFNMIIYPCKL
jgi:hypothetical protein